MFPQCKLSADKVAAHLAAVGEDEALVSLRRPVKGFTDFLNLLSPAAASLLPEAAVAARRIKLRHFGDTVRLYSPLYLSNYCVNDCLYCGFRASQKAARRRLDLDEVLAEAETIAASGIKSLLLVCGEDPAGTPPEHLAAVAARLAEMFSYLSVEIYPLDEPGYRRLFGAGVDGVTLYQETYERGLYRRLHPSGPKSDYDARLAAIDAAGTAGMRNLGLGVLLGLNDWRLEAASLGAHAAWLKKRHWRSRIQFSFPRITPIAGGFTAPAPVSEPELEQMMLAFRLFFEEADIFLSTRERPEFRDRLAQSCASHLSAASRVVPGGYRQTAAETAEDLGQFSLNDCRSVPELTAALRGKGMDVVFKDWDSAIRGYSDILISCC